MIVFPFLPAEQGLLYEEFVRRCFPCLFMNFSRFSDLVQSLGWEQATHQDLFRCVRAVAWEGMIERWEGGRGRRKLAGVSLDVV